MTKPTSEQVTFLAAGSGASQRTVRDKLRDVVSVNDFGAVGDGVADDTAAFNNAVTAAGTRNVFVPGGSYKITGTVTGSFYSDATVTIVTGTVNTINRIGSVLSTTGALTVTGTASVSDNIIISTSGKGIDFSATPSGSGAMTGELLNDYEEGTWTPVFQFSGASVGMTFNTQVGRYTKVGRVVHIQCYVELSNKGSSTGNASIDGLPFVVGPATSAGYTAAGVRPVSISFADQFLIRSEVGTTRCVLEECASTGTLTSITDADFTNSSRVMLGMSYIAS